MRAAVLLLLSLPLAAGAVVGGRDVPASTAPAVVRIDLHAKLKNAKGETVEKDIHCSSFRLGLCVLTTEHCLKYSTNEEVKFGNIVATDRRTEAAADLALVKFAGAATDTAAGANALCPSVPEKFFDGAIVGFGGSRTADDFKKRVGALRVHSPYETSPALEGIPYPSQFGGGDSGGPLVHRNGNGKPCVGGVASTSSESWDASDEGLKLQNVEKDTRYIPGSRAERWISVVRHRRWIDEAADALQCFANVDKPLTPEAALAGVFDGKGSLGFADKAVPAAAANQLLATLRTELLDRAPAHATSVRRSATIVKDLLTLNALPRLYQPLATTEVGEFYVTAIDDKGFAVATVHTTRQGLDLRVAP